MWRFVSLSVGVAVCLVGCDQPPEVGEGFGVRKAGQQVGLQGAADPTGGQTLCGSEGGPKCELGSPCDPKGLGCQEESVGAWKCQTLADDCRSLDVPVCDQSILSCGTKKDVLVCSCGGAIMPRDCAIQNSRIAPDPSRCSRGTFPCGSDACRQGVEVCVTSKEAGGTPHCEGAAERGCDMFGIADCVCLETRESEECAFIDGGVEIRDRVEREDDPNNVLVEGYEEEQR